MDLGVRRRRRSRKRDQTRDKREGGGAEAGEGGGAPQRLPAKRSDATELEAAGDIILDDADATAVCERSGATDSLEAAGDIDDVDDADATAV